MDVVVSNIQQIGGNLDVDMGEIKNDEFGRLILDYKKLIEAQKEEAEVHHRL